MIRRPGLFGLALFGICATWSVAVPPLAGPDERAHLLRAASVARGEIVGERISVDGSDAWTEVTVPDWITRAGQCASADADRAPDCRQTLRGGNHSVRARTYVGRYPPLYYLLVGWPTLLWHGTAALYAARLVTALLVAAFAAATAAALRHASDRAARGIGLGLAVGFTPIAAFIGGMVNPSAIEIAATIYLATTLAIAGTLQTPREASRRALARHLAVAMAATALSRGLGLLWVGVLLGVAASIWGARSTLRGAWSARERVGAGTSLTFATGWLALIGGYQIIKVEPTLGWTPAQTVAHAAPILRRVAEEMVHKYQWLEVRIPIGAVWLWLGLAAAVVVLSIVKAQGARQRLGLLGLIGATCALPVCALALRADGDGFFWQGRYSLPLAAATLIFAGACLPEFSGTRGRHLRGLGSAALAAIHLVAIAAVLRRNDGDLWGVPLSPVLILVVGAGAQALARYSLRGFGSAKMTGRRPPPLSRSQT